MVDRGERPGHGEQHINSWVRTHTHIPAAGWLVCEAEPEAVVVVVEVEPVVGKPPAPADDWLVCEEGPVVVIAAGVTPLCVSPPGSGALGGLGGLKVALAPPW